MSRGRKPGPTSPLSVRPSRFPGDPRIARAAGCVGCGKLRPPIAIRHEDPFCSTACCAAWYLVVSREPARRGRRPLLMASGGL